MKLFMMKNVMIAHCLRLGSLGKPALRRRFAGGRSVGQCSWTTPVREAGVARRGHGAQTHCGGGLCRSHRELESWHGLFRLVLDRAIRFQMWAAPRRAQGCRLLLSTETKQKIEAKGQRKALEGNKWCR